MNNKVQYHDNRHRPLRTAQRADATEKAYAFYSAAVIEEARLNAKVTKAELARRIGVDRSYITKVENGTIEPRVSTFYRILSALGCTLSINLHPQTL